jgi:hypothetical protein
MKQPFSDFRFLRGPAFVDPAECEPAGAEPLASVALSSRDPG